jgi:hypothetical protein
VRWRGRRIWWHHAGPTGGRCEPARSVGVGLEPRNIALVEVDPHTGVVSAGIPRVQPKGRVEVEEGAEVIAPPGEGHPPVIPDDWIIRLEPAGLAVVGDGQLEPSQQGLSEAPVMIDGRVGRTGRQRLGEGRDGLRWLAASKQGVASRPIDHRGIGADLQPDLGLAFPRAGPGNHSDLHDGRGHVEPRPGADLGAALTGADRQVRQSDTRGKPFRSGWSVARGIRRGSTGSGSTDSGRPPGAGFQAG